MIYRFAEYTLDGDLFELRRGDELLSIERRVLDLILHLVRNRDRIVTRTELSELLWPDTTVDDAHGLDQAVYTARRALSDDAQSPRFIATIRGRGLRFVGDVRERIQASQNGSEPFVGRSSALGCLVSVMASLQDGGCAFVLVTGEPGIGKSRLLDEFRTWAVDEGLRTFLVRCPADSGAPPFWPWRQLLSDLRASESTEAGSARTAHLPALSTLESGIEAPRASNDPRDAGRFLLFEAVSQLWASVASDAPTAVVLDDIDCADRSSIALLSHLVRQRRGKGLLLLASCRTPEFRGGRERSSVSALAELASETILLPPLNRPEVELYVRSVLGGTLSPESAARIVERTGGNPFFLKQLCAAGWHCLEGAAALPASLRQLVLSRTASLSRTCFEALEIACVIGREFPTTILQGVIGRPVYQDLAEAERAGLVRKTTTDSFEFTHDIVREQLYECLAPSDRARAHEQVLSALEASDLASPARLAHHVHLAGRRVSDEYALGVLIDAGEEAMRAHAYEEASQYFEAALERCRLAEVADQEVRVRFGQALLRAGRRSDATRELVAACRSAEVRGDRETCAASALSIAPGFFSIEAGVVDPESVAALRAALASVEGRSPSAESVVRSRLAVSLYWDPSARRERNLLVSKALRESERASPLARIETLAYRIGALWSPRNQANRRRLAARLIREADRLGARELALMGHVFQITSSLEMGDLSSVTAHCHFFNRRLEAARLPQVSWYHHLFKGMFAGLQGNLDDLENAAKRLLESGAGTADVNVINSFGTLLLFARWHQGRLNEVVDLIPDLAERFPTVPAWRTARALFLHEVGRVDEARREYEVLIRLWRRWDENLTWALSIAHLGDLCADIGDRDGAAALREALLPLSGRACVVGFGVLYWGAIDRVIARLSAALELTDDAEGRLREAVAFEEAMGATLWRTRAQLDLAEILIERGASKARGEVRHLLRDAKVSCAAFGLIALGKRVALVEQSAHEAWGS